MLTFIEGSSGSGKSYFIREKIASLLARKEERIILLVPEQFSFESERQIHRLLGPRRAALVEVMSFTRLAEMIFREYGGLAGKYADNSKKLVLMNLAVHELKDDLSFYRKASAYESFTSLMLETVEELKNAGIQPGRLEEAALGAESDNLRRKAQDIGKIYDVYDALLHKTFLDPLESLERAAEKVKGTAYFADTVIFVDEFKGFTAGELALLKEMISQSPQLYVSLCMEEEEEGEYGLFAFVKATRDRLSRLARQSGVTVGVPIRLQPGARFDDPELRYLERIALRPGGKPYEGEKTGGVKLAAAQNEYEEVDYALGTVLDWVQNEGYRYRDIVVIARDLDTYRPALESAFEKFGIPYYMDERNPVTDKPLIRFVLSFLELAAKGLTTEGVLGLLKCGLTPFSSEQVGELENYCYTWDIRGKAWRQPFTANPSGFAPELTEEDRAVLERVNQIRAYVASGLEAFTGSCGDTARSVSLALYEALDQMEVRRCLKETIQELEEQNQPVLAEEYARVWEILLELMDAVVQAAGGVSMTLARYEELLSLVAGAYDMGSLPQTLDSVAVGNANRMRTENPKAAVILGANQGVFPFIPTAGGAFSQQERAALLRLGAEFLETSEQAIAEERFIAYKALAVPSSRLLITARRGDVAGKPLRPSELFSQAKTLLGKDSVVDASQAGLFHYCRSLSTAFLKLAENYRWDTQETAALREYLSRQEGYQSKVELLQQMVLKKPLSLNDPMTIRELFGSHMRLSPSRIESFYQCRFQYFCSGGMKVKPRSRAELNPIETGSLIHQVLYALTSSQEFDFAALPEKELRAAVRKELDDYLMTVMGGMEGKSARFQYLYSRMGRTVYKIARHLQQELSQSLFRPSDFELEISPKGEVPPLQVRTPDGTVISIQGRIDRVDTYEDKNTGEKYVRVVDYKSGAKKFQLSDLYYGLNLQMLVYLFCIWKNGRGRYQGMLPAGVLYMPAKEPTPGLPREADEGAAQKEEMAQYRMNGLVLSDPTILQAMDQEGAGIFIPARLNKDGEPDKNSSVVSLAEMGKLYRHTCRLAEQMAEQLFDGRIEAEPVEGLGYTPCAYCDFKSVCGISPEDSCREIKSFSSKEEMWGRMEEFDRPQK